MVQMNLFTKQNWSPKYRKQTAIPGRKWGDTLGVIRIDIYTLLYIK